MYSQVPITLTSSNFPGSNDTLRYSNAQLTSVGNYTQTGANFVWNYSLVPTSQVVRSYKASYLTPYAFFFLGLNEYGEKIIQDNAIGTLNSYF